MFSFILMALLIVVPLLAIEGALRIFFPQALGLPAFAYDPALGQIPVPGQVSWRSNPDDGAYRTSNDDEGFRITGFTSRETAKLRILAVGDSFTYGSGVDDDETYPYRIEQALSTSGLSSAVWNAGNPGTGTDYALRLLQLKGPRIRPDVVVVGFFANDFVDNGGHRYFKPRSDGTLEVQNVAETYRFFREKQGLVRSKVYGFFCSHSHLLSLARRYLASARLAGVGGDWIRFLKNPPQLALYEKGLANQSGDVSDTPILMREMLREAKRQQIKRLLWVYLPNQIDVQNARNGRGVYLDERKFFEIAQAEGADAISLTPAFAESGEPIGSLFLKEGHWAKRAHEIAGKTIALELRR